METINLAYWEELEHDMLANVKSFEEMVPIAITILKRMSETGCEVVEICGPMSTGGRGSLQANMEYFKKAMNLASEKGLMVFDQTMFQETMGRLAADQAPNAEYCTDILDVFYQGIFQSGYIKKFLFLPDWSSSKGATWEHTVAVDHNIIVEDYPAEWLLLLN